MTDKREIKMAFDYTRVRLKAGEVAEFAESLDTGAWTPSARDLAPGGGCESSINDPKIADDIRENPNDYLVTGTVEDHIKTGRYLGIVPVPGPIKQVWWVDWTSEGHDVKNPHESGERTYYGMSPGGSPGEGETPTTAELNAINEGLR